MIIMIRKGAEPEKIEALKQWLSRYDVSVDSATIWGSVVIRLEGDLSKVDTSLIKRFDCVAMVTSTEEPYKYASCILPYNADERQYAFLRISSASAVYPGAITPSETSPLR